MDIWIEIFPASKEHKEQRPVILSIEGGSGTPKTSRRQAFRQAKEAAGIPKSAQYKTHKFVYDGTSENRIVYEFENLR